VLVAPFHYLHRAIGCLVAESPLPGGKAAFSDNTKEVLGLVAAFAGLLAGRYRIAAACMRSATHTDVFLRRIGNIVSDLQNAFPGNAVAPSLEELRKLIQDCREELGVAQMVYDIATDQSRKLPTVETPLEEVLKDATERFKRVAPGALAIDLPKVADHRRVLLQPEAARSVLFELFHNAWKYGLHGEQIQVQVIDRQNEVTISVSNMVGAEIPAEAKKRISDQGFRWPPPAVGGRRTGTGLGLWQARLLVEAQGGSIETPQNEGECEPQFTLNVTFAASPPSPLTEKEP